MGQRPPSKLPEGAPSPRDTRGRVLESACAVFAEKGFRDARVQEICRRAGANVASVNYYFGDKQTLYDQAWRHAYDVCSARYPLDGDLPDDAGPDDRLRVTVRAMLGRIFDAGLAGRFAKMVLKEMAEPTDALDGMIQQSIRPHAERIIGMVNELTGNDLPTIRVMFCVSSIISQYVHCTFNAPIRRHFIGREGFDPEELDLLADHITSFSLAGVREVHRRYRESQSCE